jgi:hypothetical protein
MDHRDLTPYTPSECYEVWRMFRGAGEIDRTLEWNEWLYTWGQISYEVLQHYRKIYP